MTAAKGLAVFCFDIDPGTAGAFRGSSFRICPVSCVCDGIFIALNTNFAVPVVYYCAFDYTVLQGGVASQPYLS